ncbi:hypothetical protein Tco_0529880 [Tanacetum coccineum]
MAIRMMYLRIPSIAIIEVVRLLGCLFGFPKSKLSIPSSYFSSLIPLRRWKLDVLVGIESGLSKRKFGIVCHGKVVRIPLEGDEYFGFIGERTQGVHQCRLLRREAWSSFEVSVGITEEVEVSNVKDKILATPSETSKVENAPAEMLCDLDQQMEKRADDGKANMVTDVLSRKERVKPRRVRAMAMTIRYGVLLVGSEMDEAHASRLRWMIYLVVLADAAESVRDTIGFEYCLASSSGWTKSPVLWAEIGESSLTGPELVLDTTDKVVLIKEKLKAARDRQKSYADKRRKPLEFEVGDRVLLKVSPWKGVELSSVHDTFHVSNLKKCLADANLHVSLNEIKIDKTLRFVEELIEIMDREIRNLKRSKIPLVKVHWNSKRGPDGSVKTI